LCVDRIMPGYPAADDSREQRKKGSQPNLHRSFIHNPEIVKRIEESL